MARAVTIGNGNLLVGLDNRGQVRDFYFPYVGHSNHVSGASGSYLHRIGVWVDGTLNWLSDPQWEIDAGCAEATATSDIHAYNSALGIRLHIKDAVHNEKDIFVRNVIVHNERDEAREMRVFFAQEFRISESRRGDTAFYDPRVHAIVHYKGHVVFLVNAMVEDAPFTEYTVGLFGIEGKEGSYADAEDGTLSRNAIEHGSVDSVIGCVLHLEPHAHAGVNYWITAAETVQDAHMLNEYVLNEKPEQLIASTDSYWHAWLVKESKDLSAIDPQMQSLYQRSLAIIRVHTDNRGGIIASSDSDILNQGRDTSSYVWPRDAALIATALDCAGYHNSTQRFFKFIADLIEPEGYLMHKYRVDGVLGSSWHPWVRNGKTEFPIQEDETALVVYALWRHYKKAHDVEFIESMYNSFIEPASEFMCTHIHEETGLPKSSYDLWEEKYGSSTYTAAAVYGGLTAAAEISALLGKRRYAEKYRTHAERIKQAILGYLYDPKQKMFVKLVEEDGENLTYDRTIDISSFHGIVHFGVLPVFDKRVVEAAEVVRAKLCTNSEFSGYVRYEEDQYYIDREVGMPNPWIITTLWMAQYYICTAKTRSDLKRAYEILEWVRDRATKSGILPEQIHPHTGVHLSTSPLVWSHAEFVLTIDQYLKKFNLVS